MLCNLNIHDVLCRFILIRTTHWLSYRIGATVHAGPCQSQCSHEDVRVANHFHYNENNHTIASELCWGLCLGAVTKTNNDETIKAIELVNCTNEEAATWLKSPFPQS